MSKTTRGPKPYHWTPEKDALFKTMTDRQIAYQLNLSLPTIRKRRRALGLEANPSPRGRPVKMHWTPDKDALLGTDLDEVIAQQLGFAVYAVAARRQKLGIAKVSRRTARWNDPDVIASLGTTTDAELAQRFGVCRERIRQVRQRHGIPKYATDPDWTQVEDRLGIDADVSISQTLGVNIQKVRRYRARRRILMETLPNERELDAREDIPQNWRDLLGVVSDRKLAKAWGFSVQSVFRLRHHFAIPPATPKPAQKVDWKDPDNLARLGVEPDSHLAAEWGVSTTVVGAQRKKRGLPRVVPKKRRRKAR